MKNFSHYIKDEFTTPLYWLDHIQHNQVYIKRDDLIPYSFGGNKARKAFLFFDEIDKGEYDCVVTYGSSHSNHCRVVANMAAERNMKCYIVAPYESSDITYNSGFVEMCSGKYKFVHVDQVHDTLEELMRSLKEEHKHPYFIPGGGHGNIGTQAYVNCYKEILDYEKEKRMQFDYIFLASGTGTTQAGLVCGKELFGGKEKIIGISIARKNPYGKEVVIDSVKEYLSYIDEKELIQRAQKNVIFIDDYIENGYGKESKEIRNFIKSSYIQYGVPMDSTYVAKAFYGMQRYLIAEKIQHCNILFVHTGGTPLFFDDINHIMEEMK